MGLSILLLACNSEDEDMRLFISSLSSSGGVTPTTEYNLIDESFSSVSSDWTNNGFTVNNGLEASGTGGMSFNIGYNSESYLDRQATIIEVVINDISSKFAVAKNTAYRGNLATVDLSTNTLYLGVLTTQGVEPSYEFSIPITIEVEVGDTLVLSLTRSRDIMKAELYNKNNPSVIDSLIKDYATDITYHGDCWGNPSAIFFSGDIKITNLKYSSLVNFTPKVSIYGDSFIEGGALQQHGELLTNRYADKMYVSNLENMTLSGYGGCNSTGTLSYIDFEQEYIKPTYTIIALGANDSTFSVWQANVLSLISKAEAIGSIPILYTICPRADRQAFINQANDWVMNTAGYDYIDAAAAVSVNNDRLTWVAEYVYEDIVHPNIAGNQAIYDWIVVNNNYLV